MSESGTLLVADTSAVINLHATGCAEQLIDALPYRFVVVDIVAAELASGRCRGHPNADLLQSLVEQRLVEVTTLDDAASLHFEELVIGPAAETLDDGEAATIAYAVVRNGTVILDERKGIRICSGASRIFASRVVSISFLTPQLAKFWARRRWLKRCSTRCVRAG